MIDKNVSYGYSKADADNNSRDPIAEGDYEVVLEKAEIKVIESSGATKLAIQFRVRDDVEQNFKNRCVFEDIWAEREHPEFINRRRLNQLMKALDFKDGTEFRNIDDLISNLVGNYLSIRVTKETDDFYGDARVINRIKWYDLTKHPAQTLSTNYKDNNYSEDKAKRQGIIEDDLPF